MLLLALACTEPAGRVHEADGRLFDEHGRELVLRGVNARVEGLFDVTFDDGRIPLETLPAFGSEDCRVLAEDLGMNLLRLPINWSALEPERDAYDLDYVDAVFGLVDDCHAHGVYTLVDLHQDAYGKDIGEDGAPLWAIVPAPDELLEGPLEDLEARRTSAQVLAAFASLYANEEGLHDEYAELGTLLAPHFAEHPGAIGLELQNEPVPLGDRAGLDALHDAIATAVRAEDPDVMVLFEPDSFRNLVDFTEIDTPFPHDNAVYAPHLYTGVFQGEPGSLQELESSFDGMLDEADEHGAALLIGEFGADPSTDEGLRWLDDALGVMDTGRASWAFWVYEEFGQGQWGLYDTEDDVRSGVRDHVADRLARPFPMAVDGTLDGFEWDGTTLTVSLSDAGRGDHVVSAPERLGAPSGATCDGRDARLDAGAGRAMVSCRGETLTVSWSD